MAVQRELIQVTWPTAANTVSVSSGGNATSEEVTVDAKKIRGELQIKADNGGTPAAGDTITAKILKSGGDPDADPDSADEFDSAVAAEFLIHFDTNDDDPSIRTVHLPTVCPKFKLYVESGAASNSITVSAQYVEQNDSGA